MSKATVATPRISIIIPAYKSARYIAATLNSVLAQTLCDWECIVVDDGSPDEVAAIVQEYAARDPRFHMIRQQNAGVSAARNAGYAHASRSVEYVIFQDSDDVWEPDALEVLTTALDAHPDAAGAHGLAERIGPGGEPLPDRHADFMRGRFGYAGRLVPLGLDQPTTLDSLLTIFNMYPPGVVLVRRPLIARAGLWDEDRSLAPSDDWDMFARVSRCGPFIFVDRVVARYRKHDSNVSANAPGHSIRRQRILRRIVGSRDSTPEQTLLACRAAWAWREAVCARQWQAFLASLPQRPTA